MSLAVVTGASGGIGLELAKQIAADGYDVLLVARRESELARAAADIARDHGVAATVCTADLATSEGIDAVVASIGQRPVDVLVNNAGVGLHGRFDEVDEAALRALIDLNITSLTILTRRLLPRMVEHGSGRIINLASTAAFQAGPFMAAYYASKAYVLLLSEAIAEECTGTGVSVTALCPGYTDTGFQAAADLSTKSLLSRMPGPDAAGVAKAGWSGAKSGRRVVIPGIVNTVAAQSIRIAPRRVVTAFVRRMHPV